MAMRNSTMPGLPQPYNLRPKRSMLTTPMKKMIFYILALFALSFIIWEFTQTSRQETSFSLDTDAISTRKTVQKAQGNEQQQPPKADNAEVHILPVGDAQVVQQKAVGPGGVGIDALL